MYTYIYMATCKYPLLNERASGGLRREVCAAPCLHHFYCFHLFYNGFLIFVGKLLAFLRGCFWVCARVCAIYFHNVSVWSAPRSAPICFVHATSQFPFRSVLSVRNSCLFPCQQSSFFNIIHTNHSRLHGASSRQP